jgi:hypothetical protein
MARRRTIEADPLDLVPIMNLVTILIPFLLMAMKSFELSVIDTTLPAISQKSAPAPNPEDPPLSLKLVINQFGIDVRGADKYLYGEAGAPKVSEGETAKPRITCKSQGLCRGLVDYNWAMLRKDLTLIKKKAVEESRDSDNVIFLPERNIRYELVVAMMDTSRNGSSISELGIKDADMVAKTDKKGQPVLLDGKALQVARKLFPNVVMAGGLSLPGQK